VTPTGERDTPRYTITEPPGAPKPQFKAHHGNAGGVVCRSGRGVTLAGMARASVPGAVNQNLRALVWQALTQPWANASSLPFILTGLRCGIAVRDDAGLPLDEALAQFYAALVARLGHVVAANQLMKLYEVAPDAEKAAAARVVLTRPGS